MKKILLIIILLLTSFLFISCKEDNNITPPDDNNQTEDPVVDPQPGTDTVVYAISGSTEVVEGETITLKVTANGEDVDASKITWQSENLDVATVDASGVVRGIKEGIIKIFATVTTKDGSEALIYEVSVVKKDEPASPVTISCKTELTAGEIVAVSVSFNGEAFDLEWSSSNPTVALIKDGLVFALKEGTAIIKATSVNDTNIRSRITINVKKYEAEDASSEDINYVKNIMKNMTIDEMIGQLVMGSEAGVSVTSNTINMIKNKKLGNFIFMGNNTPSGVEAAGLATALQNLFIDNLAIPAFIAIDQETGRICRLTNGATRFLGNMASAATGDPHDRYLIGEAVGNELKTYGINFDLTPVLDVNNNPNNPVINNRSFSDSQMLVALYGEEMLKGLMSENVMACAKHFPGHGNTATDSHYGLPIINSSIDSLYRIELAPFIHAIYSGIDAIMTTHILFTEIDSDYPATLSSKVLTGLLRETLGFNGMIVTDGMEMQAITNYYGKSEAPVLAILAGADMLCYTTLSGAETAIDAIKAAFDSGRITKERIEESVLRILLKKKKYNLFEEYLPKEGYATYNTLEHDALNLELAKKAVTLYKGEFNGLDKNKKTIIFSSKCSYQLKNYSGTNNSFGKYAMDYLKSKGMKDIDFEYISSLTTSDIDGFISEAKEYEQIVVAISDANAAQVKFVNQLVKERPDTIVIALNLPYDINSYNGVNTYICVYENTPIMVEALTYYMNGEFIATGKSPITLNK